MSILRQCSSALKSQLASGPAPRGQADLFTLTLASSVTYRWTSWDTNLTVGGNTYMAAAPWLGRGRWNLTNTMEIPTLEVYILDNTQTAFGTGTTSLRNQVANGLLDGAIFAMSRVFMPTINPPDTSSLGLVTLFIGDVGAATLLGAKITLKIRGKNSRLSVNAPVNLYQPSCIHTFCDAGCTLSSASFTLSYTVIGATRSTIDVGIGSMINQQVKSGTLTMTSGANAGLQRSVIDFSSTGGLVPLLINVTLSYPLPFAPVTGDTFTLFYGCDKTQATCANVYSNSANYRGFPYTPPPDLTAPNQAPT